jgi:Ulp1 family protease
VEQGTKKKKKDLDIFRWDITFISLHLGRYWILVVLDQVCDSNTHHKTPGIRVRVLANVVSYLRSQHPNKRRSEFKELSSYTQHFIYSGEVLQRGNNFDCGTFVCQVPEFWSRDEPLSFS